MTEKIIYIADDGKQFDNKDDCLVHDSMIKDMLTTGIKYLEIIKRYCTNRDDHSCCGDSHFGKCPFYSEYVDECIFMGEPSSWTMHEIEDCE